MPSILDTLNAALGDNAIGQISQQLGSDPAATSSAVSAALPVLISALAKNSSSPGGADALQAALQRHTETSPSLTAGDVDAKWEDAYAVGDEAPGGDNPTPGQDRVDDIGRALGVNYDEGEELKGSDKIADRDRHRWELDPASSDDWPHDK